MFKLKTNNLIQYSTILSHKINMNIIRVLRDYTTTNMVIKLTPPNCPHVSRNSNGRASLLFLKRLKGFVIIDT